MPTTTNPPNAVPLVKGITVYKSDTELGAGTVTSDLIGNLAGFSVVELVLDATLAGTTPSLNVYVQKLLPNGGYTDIISFTQLTATGKRYVTFTPQAATADAAISDAALTAGTIAKTVVGQTWRIKGVIAGGAPSGCAFTVYGDFIQ